MKLEQASELLVAAVLRLVEQHTAPNNFYWHEFTSEPSRRLLYARASKLWPADGIIRGDVRILRFNGGVHVEEVVKR